MDCTIFPEPAAESSSTPVIQNNKVQNKAVLPNSMILDEFLQRNAPILPSAHNSDCAVCGYKATMKESLAKHNRPHTEKEPFACADCGRKWTPKTSWKVHIRTSHTETIRIYANKENCGCSLINRRHTKKHFCETCTESLGKEKHLLNHITTIHKTPVILGEATVKQNGLHFKSSSSTAAPMMKVYEENSGYWDLCSFCEKQVKQKRTSKSMRKIMSCTEVLMLEIRSGQRKNFRYRLPYLQVSPLPQAPEVFPGLPSSTCPLCQTLL